MPRLVRFDDLTVTVFIPEDADDAVADAARAALDDPHFLDAFQTIIRQLFAIVPALAVLSVRVEE